MDAAPASSEFWTTVGPYLGIGIVALIGIIWNGLRDKIKGHEKRLNNHAQRLQDIDHLKEGD